MNLFPDTCEYDCEPNGRCTVEFASTRQGGSKGVRKGSCFPEDFGGSCTQTPTRCTRCKFKCIGRNGDKFKEEVWILNNLIHIFKKKFYTLNEQCNILIW